MQRKTGNSNSILLSQIDLIDVDDVVPGAAGPKHSSRLILGRCRRRRR